MDAGTTVQITMPEMGESVTEGTILEWLKAEGDPVEADEGIVEVSTDKVDTEIPAPASGILAKILVGPDETVPTGAVLGEIQVNGAAASTGNGGAPEAAESDADFADESVVEVAEHGAAAEADYERAAEVAGGNGAPAKEEAPAAAPSELVDVTLQEVGEAVSEGDVHQRGRMGGEWGEGAKGGRLRARGAGGGRRPAGGAPPPPEEAAEGASEAALGRGHGKAHPRAGGHARPLHGAEPRDPHGHELPHARGRHARRAPPGIEGRRQEALLHSRDRVGDRARRPRDACDDELVRGAGRQAVPDRPGRRQPRAGGRRGAPGPQPLARRAGGRAGRHAR